LSEHPQWAFDEEWGPFVVWIEHRDEDRVLGPPFVVLEEPSRLVNEGHPLQVFVAEDLLLKVHRFMCILEDGDAV
jgi:hypothetical protein